MLDLICKRTALACAAAAFLSPVAIADIGGGGATLPAVAYSGSSASTTATGPRLSAPAPGSLFFEALPSSALTYCQVGSGAGRSVLIGSLGNTDATRACPADFTVSFVNGTSGFSAPSIDADFAGSDAPAGAADYTAFVTNKAPHAQLTQFPSVVGLVAVLANQPGNPSKPKPVYLTEAELCNVFAGKITNWNQLGDQKGKAYSNLPIKLVYRSDSSGTSFAFSNHLNWVCQDAGLAQTLAPAASALPLTGANNFTVNSLFASAFPGAVVPAGSIGASGNPGVASAVIANDGAIGYVEAANAATLTSPAVSTALIAAIDTVAELNPQDGTNTARNSKVYTASNKNAATFTIPTTYVDRDGVTYNASYTDRALQANNATFGRPIGVPTALTAVQAPNPNCSFIVQPGAYAASAYKTAGSPASGYSTFPIVAVTYLLGNYALNGSPSEMEALLGSPYNTAIRSSITSVGSATGFSYLNTIRAVPLTGAGTITLNQGRINACTN